MDIFQHVIFRTGARAWEIKSTFLTNSSIINTLHSVCDYTQPFSLRIHPTAAYILCMFFH